MDLSGDWALVDDPTTVTLLARTAEATWAAGVTVNYAQRNAITKEDIEKNGALLGKKATVFHLWAAMLGGTVPKVKDRVTHLGKTYAVAAVDEQDRDANGVQRYRCICIQENA